MLYKQIPPAVIAAIILLSANPAHSNAMSSDASFDCSKASTVIEKTICTNDELKLRDRMLAGLYEKSKISDFGFGPSSQPQRQTEWLKQQKNCVNIGNITECLMTVYDDRIYELAIAVLLRDKKMALTALSQINPKAVPLAKAFVILAENPDNQGGNNNISQQQLEELTSLINEIITISYPYAGKIDESTDQSRWNSKEIASDTTNFAHFLNRASSDAEGFPAYQLPCALVLSHPGLIDATRATNGGARDMSVIMTNCSATLPPLPALDRLKEQLSKNWPNWSGSMQYTARHDFEATIDRVRTAILPKELSFDDVAHMEGVSDDVLCAAIIEIAEYYQKYLKMDKSMAYRKALYAIATFLDNAQQLY